MKTKSIELYMKSWLLLLFYCLIGGFVQAQETADWKLKKDKKGVKVYVREANDSPFKELKLDFHVEASMNAIIALLKDVDAIPNWVYKCSEARIVEEVNEEEEYYYNLMDFPWPMSDRDFVVRNKLTINPETKIMRSESWIANDKLPEREGVIRIKDMHLWWEFTPVEDNRVHILYYLKSDPGGHLPAWLVNMAIDQGPIQTIKEFRKALKDPKYKDAEIASLLLEN